MHVQCTVHTFAYTNHVTYRLFLAASIDTTLYILAGYVAYSLQKLHIIPRPKTSNNWTVEKPIEIWLHSKAPIC